MNHKVVSDLLVKGEVKGMREKENHMGGWVGRKRGGKGGKGEGGATRRGVAEGRERRGRPQDERRRRW